MCLTMPVKIISLKKEKIIVDELGKEKEATGSLIKLKVGDYVILQNNFIIKKIPKESAEEILSLLQKKS